MSEQPIDPQDSDCRQRPTPPHGSGPRRDTLQKERDDLYDRLLRKTAEFDNFRKRVERDRKDMIEWAAADVLSDLLSVVDDFDRALAAPAPPEAQSYKAGLELIQRQLAELLKKRGVTPIEALGADFDPHLHQAVAYEEVAGRARRRSRRRDGQGLQARRSPAASRAGEGGEGIVSKRDYYEILEVSRTATDQEIKSSYRKLALKFHPDRNPGDKTAEEKFKEAAEAYAILSDGDKRARYDRFGHAGVGSGAQGFDPVAVQRLRGHLRRPRRHLRLRRRQPPRRPAARRRSSLRPRDQVRAVGEGRRDQHPDSAPRDVRDLQGQRRRARHVADDLSAVPRHRPAALSAGLLHRRAHLRPVPRRRQGDRQAVPDVPGQRHDRADAQAHREDSRRHRHRPAAAPHRRRRSRHARRSSRRSLRRHLRARARVLPARRQRPALHGAARLHDARARRRDQGAGHRRRTRR